MDPCVVISGAFARKHQPYAGRLEWLGDHGIGFAPYGASPIRMSGILPFLRR